MIVYCLVSLPFSVQSHNTDCVEIKVGRGIGVEWQESTFCSVLPFWHLANDLFNITVIEIVAYVKIVGDGLIRQYLLDGTLLLRKHDRKLHVLLLGNDERKEGILMPCLLLVLAATCRCPLPFTLMMKRVLR